MKSGLPLEVGVRETKELSNGSRNQQPGGSVNPAFWDTSALAPLCVRQQPSAAVRRLLKQYQIVVWIAIALRSCILGLRTLLFMRFSIEVQVRMSS